MLEMEIHFMFVIGINIASLLLARMSRLENMNALVQNNRPGGFGM